MITHHASIRFSDSDAMGHVNHARFLSYLEDARIALFAEAAGDGSGLLDAGVILARVEVDYRRPIVLDPEPLRTDVWVSRVGTSSFDLAYRLEQRGELAAEARTVLVAYDYASASSRRLTDAERSGLERHLGGPSPA